MKSAETVDIRNAGIVGLTECAGGSDGSPADGFVFPFDEGFTGFKGGRFSNEGFVDSKAAAKAGRKSEIHDVA